MSCVDGARRGVAQAEGKESLPRRPSIPSTEPADARDLDGLDDSREAAHIACQNKLENGKGRVGARHCARTAARERPFSRPRKGSVPATATDGSFLGSRQRPAPSRGRAPPEVSNAERQGRPSKGRGKVELLRQVPTRRSIAGTLWTAPALAPLFAPLCAPTRSPSKTSEGASLFCTAGIVQIAGRRRGPKAMDSYDRVVKVGEVGVVRLLRRGRG